MGAFSSCHATSSGAALILAETAPNQGVVLYVAKWLRDHRRRAGMGGGVLSLCTSVFEEAVGEKAVFALLQGWLTLDGVSKWCG